MRQFYGVADSRYESMAEDPKSSFGVLQNHTVIQQRPACLGLRQEFVVSHVGYEECEL